MLNALDLDQTKLVELNIDGRTERSVFVTPAIADRLRNFMKEAEKEMLDNTL